MRCWKCGQENVSDAMECVHCRVNMRRSEPNSDEGVALRQLYDHYGAEALLSDSTLMIYALGDLLLDNSRFRNQLKIVLDEGIGRAYISQIQCIGKPDSDFEKRIMKMMTEDAGLSESASRKIMTKIDEMIGWENGNSQSAMTSVSQQTYEKNRFDNVITEVKTENLEKLQIDEENIIHEQRIQENPKEKRQKQSIIGIVVIVLFCAFILAFLSIYIIRGGKL